jgi:hypothetical protein
MKPKYTDEQCYQFHEKDVKEQCFLCTSKGCKLFTVRQVSTMKMVHLCGECMVSNSEEYLLDNTRPWTGNLCKPE